MSWGLEQLTCERPGPGPDEHKRCLVCHHCTLHPCPGLSSAASTSFVEQDPRCSFQTSWSSGTNRCSPQLFQSACPSARHCCPPEEHAAVAVSMPRRQLQPRRPGQDLCVRPEKACKKLGWEAARLTVTQNCQIPVCLAHNFRSQPPASEQWQPEGVSCCLKSLC